MSPDISHLPDMVYCDNAFMSYTTWRSAFVRLAFNSLISSMSRLFDTPQKSRIMP
jgi:hypothetical protein